MAGDWIKMRTDLYRDPKVCLIADFLMESDSSLSSFVSSQCRCDMAVTRNVMRNATVGALVTVWGVTRHRGKRSGDDIVIRGATLETIDDIADLQGFGDAMESVGWVTVTDEGLVFQRFFEEYNIEPGQDAASKNAERQRRFREKSNGSRNVTVALQSNDRVEKSREEKSNKTHTHTAASSEENPEQSLRLPHRADTPRNREQLDKWQQARKARHGSRMSPVSWEAEAMTYADWSEQRWFDALVFSTRKASLSILDSENDFQKRKAGGSGKPAKDYSIPKFPITDGSDKVQT